MLLLTPWWVSHLEHDWRHDGFRRFVGSLAVAHRVVRFDRVGVGMSDRDRPAGNDALELELRTIDRLGDELEAQTFRLLGISFGSTIAVAYAARRPDRVERLVVYGGYANGAAISDEPVRQSLLTLVRGNWGLGSRLLSDILMPGGTRADAAWFVGGQRVSASAEAAAGLLEDLYGTDVTEDAGRVEAPTLVVHRRDDRGIVPELGRTLATLIPGARFTLVAGSGHFPWMGDTAAVVRVARSFLEEHAEGGGDESVELLTKREREVLGLVACGLTNDQIARTLVLSPHTVHRHVANIRSKLGQPSRAAAVAEGARLGLLGRPVDA